MVNLLIAAAIAAASPVAAQPQSAPEPAIFEIHDADTTIYLFGTFHALDGNPQWFDRGVRDAFEQSNELVLETLLPEGPNAAEQLKEAMGHGPATKPSASFLATTKMAISASRAQGMQVDNGADMVLRHAAEAEGKDVEQLETLQFQLNMFNHLSAAAPQVPATARAGQPVGAQPMQDMSQTMADLQSAWKRGDQSVFVQMLDLLRTGAPDTYRLMFTERNARWADWIAARLQTPGTVFVAVGAGHLAGKDSVLVRLAEKGIPSQRVY
ncbi:MAG TPA: TraB/GumN family protein [Sphingomicrobium sp.]|nr:TraB/GumN family protein [Sphingomicrobium sp.]